MTQTSPSEPLQWRNIQVRLGDLIEWDQNPRRLTQPQAEQLRASLKKFDYVEPVVVDFDEVSLIGGHMRRRILIQRLMWDHDKMIDARAPNRPLTPKEREELAIRLNKNQGEWDDELLANNHEPQDLVEWGFEPKDFGMEDSVAEKVPTEIDSDVCPKCKRPL